MDNFTLKNIIVSKDQFEDVLVYLLLGGWAGAIINWAWASVIRKRFVFPSLYIHKHAWKSGVLNALNTACFLAANKLADPAILVALSNLTILYTASWDAGKHHAPWKATVGTSLLAFLGVVLLAFSQLGSFNDWLLIVYTIALVGIGTAGLGAVGEYVDQDGITNQDAVVYGVARLFYLAVFATVICLVANITRLDTYVSHVLTSVSQWQTWAAIGTTMTFVFVGQSLRLLAKQKSRVGFVVLVISAQIVFGFVLTFVVTKIVERLFGFSPFGSIPGDLRVWGIRIIGAILLFVAIAIMKVIDDRLSK